MFGIRKQRAEEQSKIKEIFSKVTELHQTFETTAGQMEACRERIGTDIFQIIENTGDLETHASANVEEEAAAIHALDDLSRDMKGVYDEYKNMKTLIEEHMDETMMLIEENKHYTTPTRNLKEIPATMKQHIGVFEQQIDEIAETGRTIRVLALNAAIEAGRLGEDGRQFVEATEEIRQLMSTYEEKTCTLQKEVQDSRDKIHELEDTVERLITMLKESNVATQRLLKKGQEVNKQVQNSVMRDFSENIVEIRDKVVGMRNMNEEMARCGERNRILLNDIQEDVQAQKNTLTELETDLTNFMNMVEEQIC